MPSLTADLQTLGIEIHRGQTQAEVLRSLRDRKRAGPTDFSAATRLETALIHAGLDWVATNDAFELVYDRREGLRPKGGPSGKGAVDPAAVAAKLDVGPPWIDFTALAPKEQLRIVTDAGDRGLRIEIVGRRFTARHEYRAEGHIALVPPTTKDSLYLDEQPDGFKLSSIRRLRALDGDELHVAGRAPTRSAP